MIDIFLIILIIMIFSLFIMVKVNKELTHLYHANQYMAGVDIGEYFSVAYHAVELFEKSLVLTSDLKRLPFLLGGKLYFWFDSHIHVSMVASGLAGVGATIVLMNGSYEAGDFDNFRALMQDDRAEDDILLVSHGFFGAVAGESPFVDIQNSHWDFEGQKILYDTITMIIFIDCDANVSAQNFSLTNIEAIYEIEIDWRPFNKAEMQEFIMEHIYAKQGD